MGSLRMSIYDISSNHITLVRLRLRKTFSGHFLMSHVRNAKCFILTPKNVLDVAKGRVSEE